MRFEGWCGRRGRPLVLALAAVVAAGYVLLGIVKYRAFLYDDFDLALFHQAALQLLRGSFFTSIRGMAWPGDHSSLVLLPIAPLAAVIRHPLLLVALQALALAAGALAVRRLALATTASAGAAVLLATAWLLQPALGYVALFEFHPEALSVPALMLAWVFLREGRRAPALGCAAFALLGKEDVALAVLGLAAVAAFGRRRDVALGGGLAALAVASLALTFLVLKPAFAVGIVDYGRLYRSWGPTTGQALAAMLTHPLRAAATLLGGAGGVDPLKVAFVLHLVLPWALLPFAGPAALVPAFPVVAEQLLADRLENHLFVFQYATLALPFVALAAVEGVGAIARRSGGGRAVAARALPLAALALLATLASQWAFGPFGHALLVQERATQRTFPDAHDQALAPQREALVARLAGRDSLIVGFPFLPRFGDRRVVHAAHHVLGGRYTFSSTPYPAPYGVSAALFDLDAPGLLGSLDAGTAGRWHALAAGERLVPVVAREEMLLFERDAPDTLAPVAPVPALADAPARVTFAPDLALLGAALGAERVAAGDALPVALAWRRLARSSRVHFVQWMLFDAQGQRVLWRSHPLGYVLWPDAAWSDDAARAMRERWWLVLPPDLPPGRYRLAFAVAWRDATPAPGAPATGILRPDPEPPPDGLVTVGSFEVTTR